MKIRYCLCGEPEGSMRGSKLFLRLCTLVGGLAHCFAVSIYVTDR